MGNIKIKREMKLSTYLCLIGAAAAGPSASNSSNNATGNGSLTPANGTGADNTKGGNGMVIAIVVILAVLGAAGGVWYCKKGKGDDKGAENPKEGGDKDDLYKKFLDDE